MKLSDIQPRFEIGQTVYQYEASTDAVHRGRVVGVNIDARLNTDEPGKPPRMVTRFDYLVVWGDDFAIDAVAEHRLAAHPVFPPIVEPAPSKPAQSDADGWIEWHGGECPVPKGTRVHVRVRSGGETECTCGSFVRWDHRGDDGDIVAYLIVKEPA